MITKLSTFAITMREICLNAIKQVERDERLSIDDKESLTNRLIEILKNIDKLIYDLEH